MLNMCCWFICDISSGRWSHFSYRREPVHIDIHTHTAGFTILLGHFLCCPCCINVLLCSSSAHRSIIKSIVWRWSSNISLHIRWIRWFSLLDISEEHTSHFCAPCLSISTTDLWIHLLAIPLVPISYRIDYGSWQWPKMLKLRLLIKLAFTALEHTMWKFNSTQIKQVIIHTFTNRHAAHALYSILSVYRGNERAAYYIKSFIFQFFLLYPMCGYDLFWELSIQTHLWTIK